MLSKKHPPHIQILAVILLLILFHLTNLHHLTPTAPSRPSATQQRPPGEGGRCDALESTRLPPWVDGKSQAEHFATFFQTVYNKRAIDYNAHGMLLDDSYAMYEILRQVRPRVVVESGVHKGHATWMIRQALSKARVISLDPKEPVVLLKGVEYLTGEYFIDFGNVSWMGLGVDTKEAVVLLDDHQSVRRRVFEEGARMGFTRYLIPGNYEFGKGDTLSFRWLCEVSRKDEWPGIVRDNFGRNVSRQSWQEHMLDVRMIRKRIKYYYEFPPLVSSFLSNQTRFNGNETSQAIFTTQEEFDRQLADIDRKHLHFYTHFAYVEIFE